jgi:hypothetical protein
MLSDSVAQVKAKGARKISFGEFQSALELVASRKVCSVVPQSILSA